MRCLFTVEGRGLQYFISMDTSNHTGSSGRAEIVQQIYKDNNGKEMPCYKWSPSAPWYARLMTALTEKRPHLSKKMLTSLYIAVSFF